MLCDFSCESQVLHSACARGPCVPRRHSKMADAGHDVDALSVKQLRELVTSAGNACSSLGVIGLARQRLLADCSATHSQALWPVCVCLSAHALDCLLNVKQR
jgi:hypothetical protein